MNTRFLKINMFFSALGALHLFGVFPPEEEAKLKTELTEIESELKSFEEEIKKEDEDCAKLSQLSRGSAGTATFIANELAKNKSSLAISKSSFGEDYLTKLDKLENQKKSLQEQNDEIICKINSDLNDLEVLKQETASNIEMFKSNMKTITESEKKLKADQIKLWGEIGSAESTKISLSSEFEKSSPANKILIEDNIKEIDSKLQILNDKKIELEKEIEQNSQSFLAERQKIYDAELNLEQKKQEFLEQDKPKLETQKNENILQMSLLEGDLQNLRRIKSLEMDVQDLEKKYKNLVVEDPQEIIKKSLARKLEILNKKHSLLARQREIKEKLIQPEKTVENKPNEPIVPPVDSKEPEKLPEDSKPNPEEKAVTEKPKTSELPEETKSKEIKDSSADLSEQDPDKKAQKDLPKDNKPSEQETKKSENQLQEKIPTPQNILNQSLGQIFGSLKFEQKEMEKAMQNFKKSQAEQKKAALIKKGKSESEAAQEAQKLVDAEAKELLQQHAEHEITKSSDAPDEKKKELVDKTLARLMEMAKTSLPADDAKKMLEEAVKHDPTAKQSFETLNKPEKEDKPLEQNSFWTKGRVAAALGVPAATAIALSFWRKMFGDRAAKLAAKPTEKKKKA